MLDTKIFQCQVLVSLVFLLNKSKQHCEAFRNQFSLSMQIVERFKVLKQLLFISIQGKSCHWVLYDLDYYIFQTFFRFQDWEIYQNLRSVIRRTFIYFHFHTAGNRSFYLQLLTVTLNSLGESSNKKNNWKSEPFLQNPLHRVLDLTLHLLMVEATPNIVKKAYWCHPH